MIDENGEQFGFGGTEYLFAAVFGGQGVVAQIKAPATEMGDLVSCWFVSGGFAAAQDAAYAGHQFTRLEGFEHVVVGAHLQAHDPVADVGAAGQDHDAAGRLHAHALHGFNAVHVR